MLVRNISLLATAKKRENGNRGLRGLQWGLELKYLQHLASDWHTESAGKCSL